MANTVTDLGTLPLEVIRGQKGAYVKALHVLLDTAADFTVYTPATGFRWAIVGWQYAEATAHNLIVKSATTTIVTLENAANTVRNDAVQPGKIILSGLAAGELLALNASAVITSMHLLITEYKEASLVR